MIHGTTLVLSMHRTINLSSKTLHALDGILQR